jgi:hypothetical protein
VLSLFCGVFIFQVVFDLLYFFGLFEHQFVYLGSFPVFIHKTIGDKDFNDMKNEQAAPNRNYPDPPIGFVVKAQPMIRCKQKQTPNTKHYKVLKQTLFLVDSVPGIFV